MTTEEKVVEQIKELLQKSNCVLVMETHGSKTPFNGHNWDVNVVKVVQHKDGQTLSEGAILHSE